MKIYYCDICRGIIFFENTTCLKCSSELGYLPYLDNMSSLSAPKDGIYQALAPQANGGLYRKCFNYEQEDVCNWMVPVQDKTRFCASCRLNEMIPDLTIAENRGYWYRLEVAKRRLVYSLLRLRLPIKNKDEDPVKGLAFRFLANEKNPGLKEDKRIMIGHEQGRITMNVEEANDAIREKMRLDMNERYRTLLGHFRHEIGHYYWFLIFEQDQDLLTRFRAVFGNEQKDYNSALQAYYRRGKPEGWQEQFVSAYASAHPWEDWAESWAHYLHMFDTLETAHAWGMNVTVKKDHINQIVDLSRRFESFDEMQQQWVHLSSVLNSLNRSMGLKDAYPFIWTDMTNKKLRFVHDVIRQYISRIDGQSKDHCCE